MRRWIGGTGMLVAVVLGGTRAARAETPTFHRDVERILQKNCQECHRPGQVAPFALLSYEQARKRAADIARITEDRTMPPWPASTQEGGPFRDARLLSTEDIDTLARWAETGCPKGDAKDAPAPLNWNSDWPLGKPDLVIKVAEPYQITAEGRDEHRVFVVPSGLTEGKWIAAVDFKPGNPKVVHHILAAFDITGAAQKRDDAEPGPGYKVFGGFGVFPSGGLNGWSLGKRPVVTPEGVGRYLPAGADILLQVHYHKSGKAESDATSMALYFSKSPVDKSVRGAMVLPAREGFFGRPKLRIPAGDANYTVTGTTVIEQDAHAISVTPHMHWLGKDFVLKATRPDGSVATLIHLDHWNFNWQMAYDFETPVTLPKGTRLDMLSHFDNSAQNPANPNVPPAEVHWGEQTTDEMCIGFLSLTYDNEHRHNQPPPRFALPATAKASAARARP